MKGTCDKNCPLWKKYKDKCPNYIESWWEPKEGGTPIKIRDCSSKRILLMMQEVHNRLEYLATQVERRESSQMNVLNTFMEVMQHVVNTPHSTLPLGRELPSLRGPEAVGDIHEEVGKDPEGDVQ